MATYFWKPAIGRASELISVLVHEIRRSSGRCEGLRGAAAGAVAAGAAVVEGAEDGAAEAEDGLEGGGG